MFQSNRRRHLDQCHRIRTRLPQSGKLSIESDGSTWLKLERSRLDRSRFAASAAAHEEYFLKATSIDVAVVGGTLLLKSRLRNGEPRLGQPVEAL